MAKNSKTEYNIKKYPLVSYEDSKTNDSKLPSPPAEDASADNGIKQKVTYADEPAFNPNLEHEDEW